MPSDFSKKAAVLFSIFFVVAILAWKTNVSLLYFLAIFFFLFIIGNLLFLLVQEHIGKIEVHRKIINTALEDETLDVEIDIRNRSFLPKYYLLLEDLFSASFGQARYKRQLLAQIKAKQKINTAYKGRCFKRGLYRIGPISVIFSDLLGIFFRSKTYPVYSQLIVYPKIFNIQRFPSLVKGNISSMGVGTRRVSGDDFEFFGVREYRLGDPLKKIHWRTTARLGFLAVKEYEQYAAYNVSIVLDLNKSSNIGFGKETTLEYAIKIAASCAKYLIEKGVLVQFVAHGQEPVIFPFNKGGFHLQEILKFLATAEAEGHVSLSELLTVNSEFIPTYSTVVLIMNDNDSEALGHIAELRAKNISVIPIFLLTSTFLRSDNPEIVKSRKINLLKELRVDGFFISQGDILEDKFSEAVK